MTINYEYYKIFYYVAKYKNFTQAAVALNNNQPNISRSVKNLENAFGCLLFTRSSRGVKLTPEGETLFSHIAPAVEQIESGEKELMLQKELKSGVVTVSTTETVLNCLLFSVLNRFHKSFPDVRICISNDNSPNALKMLEAGLSDFAVVTTPLTFSDKLSVYKLKSFNEIPVCGSEFSFLKDKKLSLNNLTEYPLICLGKGSSTYDFYSNLFIENGLVFNPDTVVATADLVLPLVKSNLGIGLLPESFAENDLVNGNVFQIMIDENIPKRQICLVRNKNTNLGIAANELEKMIFEACGRNESDGEEF